MQRCDPLCLAKCGSCTHFTLDRASLEREGMDGQCAQHEKVVTLDESCPDFVCSMTTQPKKPVEKRRFVRKRKS